MKLTPEEVQALVQRAPLMASGLSRPSAEKFVNGHYGTETAFEGADAMAHLRELADLVANTSVDYTLDTVARGIPLHRDEAVEVIKRIDRGDDPQEILSFVYHTLRNRRLGKAEARGRDQGA